MRKGQGRTGMGVVWGGSGRGAREDVGGTGGHEEKREGRCRGEGVKKSDGSLRSY